MVLENQIKMRDKLAAENKKKNNRRTAEKYRNVFNVEENKLQMNLTS